MDDLTVRPLADAAELDWCARLMAGSEPWLTLGRGMEACRQSLGDSAKERYLALLDGRPAGLLILDMRGLLAGYVQSICIHPDFRSQGLGSRLLAWAEQRIFRDSANVFLCVSSFNEGAQRLYRRLGYEPVGKLTDFFVKGYDELLLRKVRGSG